MFFNFAFESVITDRSIVVWGGQGRRRRNLRKWLMMVILCVNLARPGYPVIQSNTSLDVAVR